MIKQKWFTFLACATLVVAFTALQLDLTPWLQLAILVALLVWLVVSIGSIVFAIRSWQELHIRGFIPLAGCLVTIPTAVVSARGTQALRFHYQLPQFEAVITQITQQDILPNSGHVRIPCDVARVVLAEKTAHGHLQVEFLTGGGFPVKHSGYLYVETGVLESGSFMAKRWPYTREIKPKWLRFWD